MGLFDFVITDLPSNTRAPELDDKNAKKALYANRELTGEDLPAGAAVTEATLGLYLAYLVPVRFLPSPPSNKLKKLLRRVKVLEEQKRALAGMGWARTTSIGPKKAGHTPSYNRKAVFLRMQPGSPRFSSA